MKNILSTILVAFTVQVSLAQTDISDARANFAVGQSVTITGIVTNGAEMGSSVRYVQDASAGIAVFPGNNWTSFAAPNRGDIITVTGVLSEFNGLLEVGPTLTALVVNSTANEMPEPLAITPNQMVESNEGRLVSIGNVVFANGGSLFQGNSTYSFSSEGQSGVIYVRNGSVLVGGMIPAGPVQLTGIVSQFSFTGVDGYQILPRDNEDIVLQSGINLIGQVNQQNISTSGFSLHWTTDMPGDSKVEYGISPGSLNQEIYSPASVTSHSATLTNLSPGTVYFARVISSDGEDLAQSSVKAYATKSLSGGEITVYFNGSVLNEFATVEEAIGLGANTNDTIAAYIDRAVHTMDIAMYNINDQLVVNAINAAYTRGVQIRYIAQGTNANLGIGQFNSNIPVHYRTDDNGSGMHNKFFIIDADHTELATLITGSTNATTNNLNEDYNNVIIFQDESICKGYRLEFDEMWGGEGALPEAGNSKFSIDKSINTPVKYIVGDTPVEVYFSPTDNVSNAINSAILTTNASLEFCLLAFTYDLLANSVIAVHDDFFTYVRGIIEQSSGTGTDYETLLAAGVEVYSHEGVSGQLHHKYAIVDASDPLSDPMVITGSHNWSASAENINDENTVIVHDARISNLFFQEFMARHMDFVGIEEVISTEDYVLFPNPTNNLVSLLRKDGLSMSGWVSVVDQTGKVVLSQQASGKSTIVDLSGCASGLYSLMLLVDGAPIVTKRIIKE